MRSVFDKLHDDSDNIEWTPAALGRERRFALAMYTAGLTAALEFVALMAL